MSNETNGFEQTHGMLPGMPPLPKTMEELEAMPALDAFLATLNLIDTGARTSEDIFTGASQWMPHGRVFGGQVAAQSIVAATRTVPEDRTIHSMRGYFLRPGDIQKPITYSVNRIHDGHSFSTRHVEAFQDGLPIWSMISSFQVAEESILDHQAPMPEGLPDPDSLPSESALVEQLGTKLGNYWINRRPFRLRHVDGPIYLTPSDSREAYDHVWVKASAPLPDDPIVHIAAIAYLSDYVMLEPTLRRHGLTWLDQRLRFASLDHGVWWHRFARADDWMLLRIKSPNAHAGRTLAQGYLYTRDGQLIASVSQEAMLRIKEDGASKLNAPA